MSTITLEDIQLAKAMGHTREKKPIAYTVEAQMEAKAIFEDFEEFSDGLRVILLIHRSKDGATHSSRHERMMFTRNKEEFKETLAFLLEERTKHPLQNLRVYSTVNQRNLQKAIRAFKIDQLEMDYQNEQVQSDFYTAIKSRFASCLMRPTSKKTSYFVFDIDNPMTLDEALGIIDRSGFSDTIVKQYGTKNGWHIVTLPFNHTKLEKEIPFHRDGLLLLKF